MNKQFLFPLIATLAGAVSTAMATTTDPLVQTGKLVASDAASHDFYGRSVALSNQALIIGAEGKDAPLESSGAVYIYVDTNNDGLYHDEIEYRLTAFDGDKVDNFGRAVAAFGDTLVVGAHGDNDLGSDSGSAYVYVDSDQDGNFADETAQKLNAPDGQEKDRFGYRVAAAKDVIVVSSFLDDDKGRDSGSVYLYHDNDKDGLFTDETPQKLTAFDGAYNDRYGISIAISDHILIVGTDYENTYRGAAYVYVDSDRDGNFAEETAQKLTAFDSRQRDWFGQSVAVSGNTLAIGAYGTDSNYSDSGSVYLYRDTDNDGLFTDETATKLTAADGKTTDNFGRAIALNGKTLAVTSFQDDDAAHNAGTVYVYTDSDNDGDFADETPQKATANDAKDYDYLGESLALNNNTLVASAVQSDGVGTASGSAYSFELPLKLATGKFVESSQVFAHRQSTQVVILGDIDNDTDLDFVVGRDIMINDGKGEFTNIGTINETTANARYANPSALGDLDNDGDLDLIMTISHQGSYSNHNIVFYNNGLGQFNGPGTQLYSVSGKAILADYNNDGWLDYGVSGANTQHLNQILLNQTDGNLATTGTKLNSKININYAGGDIDGDGHFDLVMSQYGTGGIDPVYFNDGQGNFTEVSLSGSNNDYHGIDTADIDGDGDLDIIMGGLSGIELYINQGNRQFILAPPQFPNSSTVYVRFKDIDNDGDPDLIVGGVSSSTIHPFGSKTLVYRNDGRGNFSDTNQALGYKVMTQSVDFGDIDNDGDMDIIFGGNGSPIKVYFNE